MDEKERRFASLADAIAALHATTAPLVLARIERTPRETVIVAANAAAAANPTTPRPGEHPDFRRDQDRTADVELEYLHEQLLQRGHAQQVLSLDGGSLYELTATRIEIAGQDGVHAFVSSKLRSPKQPAEG
jgi:hypothetical protein